MQPPNVVCLGGPPSDLWVYPNTSFKEHALTALGAVWTEQGFVIAADGRFRVDDPALLSFETDDARKIFDVRAPDVTLAYGLTGALGDPRNFYLPRELPVQIHSVTATGFKDCFQYLKAVAKQINQAIDGKMKFPELNKLEGSTAWKIADIPFVGYFNSMPSFFIVQFFNYRTSSEFRVIPGAPKAIMLAGSEVIRKAMYRENGEPMPNSLLGQYAKQLGPNPSLEDARAYLLGYIAAHSSEVGRQLDYEKWKNTGGTPHVAQITPQKGFEWVDPPLKP